MTVHGSADARFDDARLAMMVVRSAVDHGAVAANYTAVTGYLRGDDGRVQGVRVREETSGEEFDVHARAVILAGGVWTQEQQELAEADGGLVSRPMGLQEAEEGGVLWFMTRATSDAAEEAAARPVNVAVQEKSFWASVSGHAQVVRDEGRKKQYWSSVNEAFFGEGSRPEDPEIVLIRVDAESAQYWESAGAVATAVELVKAKVTGGTAEPGENTTVTF